MPKRRILIVIGAPLVVLALVLVGLRLWERAHQTALRDAMDLVPRSTLRVSFTDWSAVRDQLGVTGTGAEAVDRLTSKGYDTDLIAVSSIDGSTAALQKHFGFSPLNVEWEAYAQSRAGSTMVVRMPDGFDFDKVTGHLDELGFEKPAKDDGVWNGGIDLVAAIDPTITPELQYVAVLADEHLIVTSDSQSYAEKAAAVARGEEPSLGEVGSVRELAGKSGEPAAATLWARDFVCTDLSTAEAGQDTQQQAETLIAEAGKVSPMTGMTMALDPDRRLSVIQLYESDDQAKENLKARARLAVGEAVGRGGSFSDDLTLTSSETDGDAVVLRWKPKEKTGFVLSALDHGPVVFASC